MRLFAAFVALGLLAGCSGAKDADRPETSQDFPRAWRPVSELSGNEFGNEDQRDNLGEAEVVMDLARIKAGTTVADSGAGEGYYTVRLANGLSVSAWTMSRSRPAHPMIHACRPTALTGSFWSTCTTR